MRRFANYVLDMVLKSYSLHSVKLATVEICKVLEIFKDCQSLETRLDNRTTDRSPDWSEQRLNDCQNAFS